MKGKRTFTIAGFWSLLGLLNTMPEFRRFVTDWIPSDYHSAVFLLLAGASMAGMRLVTTTPPGKSE